MKLIKQLAESYRKREGDNAYALYSEGAWGLFKAICWLAAFVFVVFAVMTGDPLLMLIVSCMVCAWCWSSK